MSFFITFEGVEGCGKSTQARVLYRHLKKEGIDSLLTYEPGGTPPGEKIRRLLKNNTKANISSETELLLFLASRAQLVKNVIRPNLEKGVTVVCDRYSESTVAYQGYGLGLSLSTIATLNTFVTDGLRPDLIVLLDIDPKDGLQRKGQAGGDRIEKREIAFHRRVRKGYLQMAAAEPERWLVIDGSQKRRDIERAIWARLERFIKLASS